MFGQLLLGLNLVACGFLLWHGGKEERFAVAMLIAATVAEFVFGRVVIGTWPVALAMINLGLFLGFWWLAERFDRWWQFFAAVFQLISVFGYAAPLMASNLRAWTLASIQVGIWALISLLLIIGAWEAWADRTYRSEIS